MEISRGSLAEQNHIWSGLSKCQMYHGEVMQGMGEVILLWKVEASLGYF